MGAPHPLVGARRWDDIAALPIAAAAPGNHDFDTACRRCRARTPTPGWSRRRCSRPRLAEWLGRELRFEPGPLGGQAALAPRAGLTGRLDLSARMVVDDG